MKYRNISRRFGGFAQSVSGKVSAGAGLAMVSVASFAQDTSTMPSGVENAFTSLSDNASTLEGYAYPVLIAVTGGLILMGVVKKFMHKAS